MTIVRFFDRLEDKIRANLSRHPIFYSVIGGAAIVLFWRGVWHLADELQYSYHLSNLTGAMISLLVGAVVLLLTGLFTSFFIGDTIIISGLKGEKKLIEKTEEEVDQETGALKRLEGEISREEAVLLEIKKEIKGLKESVRRLEERNNDI